MKELIKKMWRLNRAIVSTGFNTALDCIKQEIDLKILSFETGKEFDTWKIPRKWELDEAYLIDMDTGKKLLDTHDNILHVVIGSLPFDSEIEKEKLARHLHYDKKRPEFIPCVYKYYDNLDWGFCCTKAQYDKVMKSQRLKAVIKTAYSDGELKLGEFTVKGKSPDTIYILSHLDGPGQANDSLSGAAVSVELVKRLSNIQTYYTYKFLYLPGTIGPMVYLHSNPDVVKNGVAAIILEMLGNNSTLTLQHSLHKDEYIDRVLHYILSREGKPFKERDFGKIIYNGERIFNAPGIDIPTVSLSRLESGDLPFHEYRTSGDSPDIIDESRLKEAVDVVLKTINILENDFVPVRKYFGIPFLSKYGLWVEWSQYPELRVQINNILFLLNNNNSVFEIARELNLDYKEVYEFINKMAENKLVDKRQVFISEN